MLHRLTSTTSAIAPVAIRVAQSELHDLQQRLQRVRWPDALQNARWEFGSSLDFMKLLHAHWMGRYDWRAMEAALNKNSHFVYELGDRQIHFIHEQGVGPDPIPLILTHGWPGSFVEMLKIIPLLTNPAAHGGAQTDAFTVIAPSIPGYGFSSKPRQRGTNVFVVADLWASLMTELGYQQFGVQGGD